MIACGNSWRSSYGAIFSPSSPSANWRATSRMCDCSGVRSKSTGVASDRRADVLADEAHDVLRGGAGSEQLLHADGLQPGDVLRRDDAAAEDGDVVRAFFFEELEHALEEVVVRAGEHAEPDRIRVFLDGGGHDLLRRLMQPGVDH